MAEENLYYGIAMFGYGMIAAGGLVTAIGAYLQIRKDNKSKKNEN